MKTLSLLPRQILKDLPYHTEINTQGAPVSELGRTKNTRYKWLKSLNGCFVSRPIQWVNRLDLIAPIVLLLLGQVITLEACVFAMMQVQCGV